MYKGAVRLNLAKFFTYTGVFLILVAAGILSYGIGALQTVGWLPGLAHRAFDITSGSTGRRGTARRSRASSTSRRHRPSCSSCAGSATSSSYWRCSCVPPNAPSGARDRLLVPDPESNVSKPKGRPREPHFPTAARTGIAAAATLLAGMPLTGCTAKEPTATERDRRRPRRGGLRSSPSPPPTPPASCRPPTAPPAPTRSSSPTTATRSPSSTSTARASG